MLSGRDLLLSAGINFTIALLLKERRMAHGSVRRSRLLLQVSNARAVLCHMLKKIKAIYILKVYFLAKYHMWNIT